MLFSESHGPSPRLDGNATRRIWEQSTVAANRLFDQCRHAEAQAVYERCLNISRSAFKLIVSTNDVQDHVLPMYVVSVANVGRNLEALDRRDDARLVIAEALDVIAAPVYDELTSTDVKDKILQHLPRLVNEAGNFLEGVDGTHETLANAMEAAKISVSYHVVKKSRRYIH